MKASKFVVVLIKFVLLNVLVVLISLLFLIIGSSLLGRIDQLLLLTPCNIYEEDVGREIINDDHKMGLFDAMLWILFVKPGISYMMRSAQKETNIISNISNLFFSDDYCQFCINYRKYRCQFRMDNVYLSYDWKRIHMKNISIHSNDQCDFYPIINPDATIRNTVMFFHSYKEYGDIDILRTVVVDKRDNRMLNHFSHPPLVQINEMAISVDDFFKPIISTNISGIVLNIVFGPNIVQMNGGGMGNLEVPVPMFIWVGGFTLNELFDLIPPPPEEVGLYPRLGITNVTDAKIIIHDKDDNGSMAYIHIPDEYFLPLHQVTIDAGNDGIDQIKISAMVKEWVIMVIRKELLGEDKLRVSFDKYNEIMKIFTKFLLDKLKEGNIIFDEKVNELLNKLKDVLDSWDEEWKDVLATFDNELIKVVKNITVGIDEMKENMDKLQDSFDDVWQGIRKDATEAWEEMKKNVDADLENIHSFAQKQASSIASTLTNLIGKKSF